MSPWGVIAALGGAGMVGGLLNGYFAYEGFLFPRIERLSNGSKVLNLGFLGNVLVGGVTSVVLAALYSPLGSIDILSSFRGTGMGLTLNALAGAVLSGVGGARLLTQEAERRYDRFARAELSSAVSSAVEREKRPGSAESGTENG